MSSCNCEGGFGSWVCASAGACIPPCESENWPSLVGKTCIEARTAIFAKYPGLSVVCAMVSNLPSEFVSGYVVVLDDSTSLFTGVGYGRYVAPVVVLPLVTECVAKQENVNAVVCDLPEGTTCPYDTDDFNMPGGSNCVETTTYACQEDGTFKAIGIKQQCNGLGVSVPAA